MEDFGVLAGLDEINRTLKDIRNHIIKMRIDLQHIRESSIGNQGVGVSSPPYKKKKWKKNGRK